MLDGDSQLALAATLKNINTGSIPYRGLKDRTLTDHVEGYILNQLYIRAKAEFSI